MSDKIKWPWAVALEAATDVLIRLEDACLPDRCVIAGSIRRQKPEVGDVELLYSPKYVEVPDGLFDTKPQDQAEEVIARMLADGIIEKRLNVAGHPTWGPLNKLGRHRASGIPVDLFCEPDPDDWFRSLVIRTGPKEMNKLLMETAGKVGIIPHAYGVAFNRPDGTRVIADSEEAVFRICGMAYKEPKDR